MLPALIIMLFLKGTWIYIPYSGLALVEKETAVKGVQADPRAWKDF